MNGTGNTQGHGTTQGESREDNHYWIMQLCVFMVQDYPGSQQTHVQSVCQNQKNQDFCQEINIRFSSLEYQPVMKHARAGQQSQNYGINPEKHRADGWNIEPRRGNQPYRKINDDPTARAGGEVLESLFLKVGRVMIEHGRNNSGADYTKHSRPFRPGPAVVCRWQPIASPFDPERSPFSTHTGPKTIRRFSPETASSWPPGTPCP